MYVWLAPLLLPVPFLFPLTTDVLGNFLFASTPFTLVFIGFVLVVAYRKRHPMAGNLLAAKLIPTPDNIEAVILARALLERQGEGLPERGNERERPCDPHLASRKHRICRNYRTVTPADWRARRIDELAHEWT